MRLCGRERRRDVRRCIAATFLWRSGVCRRIHVALAPQVRNEEELARSEGPATC